MANESTRESNTPDSPPSSKTSDRIHKNAEDFKDATSRAVHRTHDTLDRAADKVERGVHRGTDKVASAADRTAERSREAYDDVMAHAGDWADEVRQYVREKPTQSLVMAVAAGWLIGRLIRRH